MDVLISGVGTVAPQDPVAWLNAGCPDTTNWPDITLIDVPEGAPEQACECADFDLTNEIPTKYPFVDRCSALAMGAAARALRDAGLDITRDRSEQIGLCFGTTWGCLDAMRVYYEKIKSGKPKFASPLPFSHSFANSPSSLLAIEFGLRGFATTYSEGHTAGAAAFLSGCNAIRNGTAAQVLVVAADAISVGTYRHYLALGRLANPSHGASDAGAFVLGEGAAALLLESEASLNRRNGTTIARVLHAGIGASAETAAGSMQTTVDTIRFGHAPESPEADRIEQQLFASNPGANPWFIRSAMGHGMSASALLSLAVAAKSGSGKQAQVLASDDATAAYCFGVQCA